VNAKDLTLNIAVNMGRLGRWADEEKFGRVNNFLNETEEYLAQLEKVKKSDKFNPTFKRFKQVFARLKKSPEVGEAWAEEALTWANILTHRAKLA